MALLQPGSHLRVEEMGPCYDSLVPGLGRMLAEGPQPWPVIWALWVLSAQLMPTHFCLLPSLPPVLAPRSQVLTGAPAPTQNYSKHVGLKNLFLGNTDSIPTSSCREASICCLVSCALSVIPRHPQPGGHCYSSSADEEVQDEAHPGGEGQGQGVPPGASGDQPAPHP